MPRETVIFAELPRQQQDCKTTPDRVGHQQVIAYDPGTYV
jgi:hypothetical protein